MRRLVFGDERLPASFWDKVTPEPMSGCWLWVGWHQRRGGYGIVKVGGARIGAHRVTLGIVEDLTAEAVDHKCCTPACVNPDHLQQVTIAENNALAGKRRTKCLNGHPRTPDNIYLKKTKRGIERTCRLCHRAHQRRYYSVRWKATPATAEREG
jgi:hypothetical protein